MGDKILVLFIIVGFCFGAFVGSFLNVVAHRLPRGESVVTPRSRCYACGTQVAWYDNLPLVSWLLLRGRCRWCGSPFSIRYWFAELICGAFTAAVVWWVFASPFAGRIWSPVWYSFSAQGAVFDVVPDWMVMAFAAGSTLLMTWALFVSTITDLDHLIIPDEISKPMQVLAPFLALGVLGGFDLGAGDWVLGFFVQHSAHGQTVLWQVGSGTLSMSLLIGGALIFLVVSLPAARWVYSNRISGPFQWKESDHKAFAKGLWWFVFALLPAFVVFLICAALANPMQGFGAIEKSMLFLAHALLGSLSGWWLIFLIGLVGTTVFKKNAMGYGDVKLMGWLGAFVGPVGVLMTFFFAACFGSLIGIPMKLFGKGSEIPFGPYLVAGAVATLLIGAWVLAQITLPPL